MLSINRSTKHEMHHHYRHFFCIFQMKQSVLPMITFTKSTLVFKENFAKEELTSIVNASFLCLGYIRKDPHWSITIFRVFGFFNIQVQH